ncbi:MAG: hypothetical protein AB3N18_04625 [Allomuricauda sp.]
MKTQAKYLKPNQVFKFVGDDVINTFIAMATSKDEAINICQLQAKKEGEVITTDEMYNLENITQTQGYEGEGEFHFEEIELNKLL